MDLYSIGYHHSHDRNFVIDRPDGISPSWLFLLFHGEAEVRIGRELHRVQKSSVIIYTDGTPQYYRACNDYYMDDWFHFTVDEADRKLFRELDIPLNRPFPIGGAAECSEIIRAMTYEFYNSKDYHYDIALLYLQMMLFHLSRDVHTKPQSSAMKASAKYDRLVTMRWQIQHTPEIIGSVQELADVYAMSVSSLQHSYKALFGVSITADIAESRVNRAKNLLSTTTMPLRQIAEQCGYHSEFHLMRQFKMATGMTPSEYRTFCK